MCPTRSPSQDTNRSTCRGECSWSGPLATPPGRCHQGPLANGPGCNPPYCLRSGGAETDTGGAPKPLRSGTSPASLAGSCHPGLPPCAAVLVPASPLTSPGVSPFPLAALPGSCRVTSVSAVRPCSGALACFVFFFFFFLLVSPPGVSVCPLPLPMSPRRLLAVLAPFLGGRGRWGWGGGGASSLSALWRKHVTSMAQARGAAPAPLQGGGGLAVRRPSSPFLPCFRTPGVFSVGACTARAPFGHGRVVCSAPSLHCLPTLPLCPRGGGGGALPAPPFLHPPPLGGRRCVWGGGGGRPCRLSCVARMSQAGRKHSAGTRRGTCPSAGRGGGLPCGSRRRPSYPAFAPPVVPPFGLARCVFPTGTAVWSVPHPLSAASPPCRCVLGEGGGRFPPSPSLTPHPWGGGGVWGGGGRPCRLSFVARMSQAGRKHSAGTRRGTCPSAGRGGGLPCGSRRRPSYPAFAPPVVPPFGLARCVFPTGTAVWSVPHPLFAASPPCRCVLGGGGGAFRPPLPSPPTLGGAEVCGRGGGAPLSSSLRSTHVAGMTQARRKHEA